MGKQKTTSTPEELHRQRVQEINGLLTDLRREQQATKALLAQLDPKREEIEQAAEVLAERQSHLVKFIHEVFANLKTDAQKILDGVIERSTEKVVADHEKWIAETLNEMVEGTRRDVEEFRAHILGKAEGATAEDIVVSFATWMGVYVTRNPRQSPTLIDLRGLFNILEGDSRKEKK